MSRIELFITLNCLSYKPAIELWKALRKALPDEEYEVIDCQDNRQRAREAGVMVEPAFVVEGKVLAVGLPGRDQLIQNVKNFIKNNSLESNREK